jgi:ubiquinone/menaquinone biosynthesis C-methylase UbiE
MRIKRETALKIHFLLDECIPPILRDQKWFMWLPFKLLFKDKAHIFLNFKNIALQISEEEFCRTYEEVSSVGVQRETDLNKGCITEIEKNILGEKVLEVGCGRGYLANILSTKYEIIACDINISQQLIHKYPNIRFKQENIQNLSFRDNEFDTVICTHTLEHVQYFNIAIKELRRVTKKRLIVVVPKQRPYKYTFDLHLHFFPFEHTFFNHMLPTNKIVAQELKEIQGDWYYQEDKEAASSSPIEAVYRDRDTPHRAPLPHHAAYGSVLRGSADQAESDPGEHKPK